MKQDARLFTKEQWQQYLKQEPSYRVKQLWQWLWKHHARDFQSMLNLPKTLRSQLEKDFLLAYVERKEVQRSKDGTLKVLFLLPDGKLVEGVLIPHGKRMTACVSSQVGCSLHCRFCATGTMGLIRQLKSYEIYDQVVLLNALAQEVYGRKLTNVVFMGMGEPLLNFSQVVRAIQHITDSEGALGMSPQRIVVSTAGIAKMIKRFADVLPKVRLALSLHAPDDEKRSKIMPINQHNNLAALIEALQYYREKSRHRITLEYLVLRGFNDSKQDAQRLAQIAKRLWAKVNLLAYNEVEGFSWKRPSKAQMERFAGYLRERGVIATIRESRGRDIDAACGQLALRHASFAQRAV